LCDLREKAEYIHARYIDSLALQFGNIDGPLLIEVLDFRR
jgi:hypothetical protein